MNRLLDRLRGIKRGKVAGIPHLETVEFPEDISIEEVRAYFAKRGIQLNERFPTPEELEAS